MHSLQYTLLSNELEFTFSKISFVNPSQLSSLTRYNFITKFSKFNKDIEINAQIGFNLKKN